MALPALVSPNHRRDLKLLRNALQGTGAIFPRSKDGTETRGSDISAGHLVPLWWGKNYGGQAVSLVAV